MTLLLAGIGLSFARDAHALSCSEIMNMVNVNVPIAIVVQTISDSGESFTTDDVRCLTNEGAPPEVISAAKKLIVGAEPATTTKPPVTKTTTPTKTTKAAVEEEELGAGKAGASDAEPSDSTGAAPDQIKDAIKLFRANKYQAASQRLFDMLEEKAYPDQEGQIEYYLARSLFGLGMYHTSQEYFLDVLRKGPQNPYFKHALPKLVEIARYTGDNSELLRIISKIPPEAFPRSARNTLNYLMGVRYFEEDNLAKAKNAFSQISEKSNESLRSKYFEGVIYNRQGKLKSAVRSFRDVFKAPVEVANQYELQQVDDIKNLALVNVARIYYSIQRFDESAKYYGLVDRKSGYWPTALFEAAWANFMRNDLNLALGEILTVQSPFYAEEEFLPEATILKALTFFNLCEYNEVERLLIRFEDTYSPMHREMKDFVQTYAPEESKKLADQAYDAYFVQYPRDSVLPKSVFTRILRNRNLDGLVRHLDLMEKEKELIDSQKSGWRDTIGASLKKQIEEDEQRYKRRAGLVFLSEMARLTTYMGDLLDQSKIIRFEVVDAQRVDYEYKTQNPEIKDFGKGLEVNFATSVDFIYWPFNGEFWQDELGYYRYTEQGSCK